MVRPSPSVSVLVEGHVRFALARSAVFRRRLPPATDRDAIDSAALFGLLQAARRFDPDSGVVFATFAQHRIVGAMRDEVRRQTGVRAGREGSTLIQMEEIPEEAQFEDTRRDPVREAVSADLVELVRSAIDRLPDNERHVVLAVDLGGDPLRVAAEQLGLSESRAGQLRKVAHARLREALEGVSW